jgi:hypothetical protein
MREALRFGHVSSLHGGRGECAGLYREDEPVEHFLT